MPKPLRAPVKPSRVDGNGKASAEASVTDRLERIENILVAVQQTLDVQFKRIAAIQAELDHLRARSQT